MWKKNGKMFVNPLRSGGRLIFNPTDEDLKASGYIWEEPKPVPPPDTTAFDSACLQFREICGQIGALIGAVEFRGGFDEMTLFQQSEAYGTLQGLQLAIAWSAANELCVYEGRKIGLGQPEWWYACWRKAD